MKKFLLFFAVSSLAQADGATTFASPARHVSLIELYTSEGCSSCPPAERWLASLAGSEGLWTDFVPVQFHVDYWDRLGWKDRLARPEFTLRQYAYASAWKSDSVYTPCFVLDGREWHPRTLSAANSPTSGVLTVSLEPGNRCRIAFQASSNLPLPLEAHVALLGSGLESRVTAGENGGRRLRHDFVVLSFGSAAMVLKDGAWRAELALPSPNDAQARRQAVAAWVTRRKMQGVEQAVGGWLP